MFSLLSSSFVTGLFSGDITHSGHIFLLLSFLLSRQLFRALLHAFVDLLPSPRHTFAMLVEDQAKCGVMELDQCSAFFFAEPVLQVVDHRIGHEQRPGYLDQRRLLDRLHRSPAMSVVVTE